MVDSRRRQLDDMNFKIAQLEKRREEITGKREHPETDEVERNLSALDEKLKEARIERARVLATLDAEAGEESRASSSEYDDSP